MGANYREENVTGTKWRRSFRVEVDNPFGGVAKARFHEEEITQLGDLSTIKEPCGQLDITFDQGATFPLVNPWTGDPMTDIEGNPQSASHIEAYILLHSLYIHYAKLRDGL